MTTSTLIFGPGWLGSRLARDLPGAVLTRARIDQPGEVAAALSDYEPLTVINAAGRNGTPNVDWCEGHLAETVRSNTLGPLVLADACEKRGIRLIHIGSACIFHGEGLHSEQSHAKPPSAYARSKYAADLALMGRRNVAIVRLRMPFDRMPHPRNLITKLSGYSRVIRSSNSLTSVTDFVHVMGELLSRPEANGIFHAVNPGEMSHARLLELYRELVDPAHTFQEISEGELYSSGLAHARRSSAVVENQNLPALGIHMRPIEEALRQDLTEYGKSWRGYR